MNKHDLRQLESQISSLPYSQQKYIISNIENKIESKAQSIIESSHLNKKCPHCHHDHIIKWGKAGDMRRYKCKSLTCGKSFNDLTKTPLARLKYKEKWLDNLSCMIESLTLRQIAEKLNINLTTAFRWRL